MWWGQHQRFTAFKCLGLAMDGVLASHAWHPVFDPQLLIKALNPTHIRIERHEVQGYPRLPTKLDDKYISKIYKGTLVVPVLETANIKIFCSSFGCNLNESIDNCAYLVEFTTQSYRSVSSSMNVCLSPLWFSADSGFLKKLKSESLNICANIQLNTNLEGIKYMDLNQSLVIMQISSSTSNIRKRLFLGPHHFLK